MTPVRIQLSRAKGWRMPPNTVSVARPTQFGNFFRVGSTFDGGRPIKTARHAVRLYRYHQLPLIEKEKLNRLRGKNLACWCPLDQPCHADVLLELANT